MKSVILLALLVATAPAQENFFPKAEGQGQALSTNKDSAKLSILCQKLPPKDYQLPYKGGVKAILTTAKGLTRTIDLGEIEDANFFHGRCTVVGKGTLAIDYGKGNVKKYAGTVRATVFDNHSTQTSKASDKFSISFQSKDLKVPQINFQGDLTSGQIVVTQSARSSRPPVVKRKSEGSGSGSPQP